MNIGLGEENKKKVAVCVVDGEDAQNRRTATCWMLSFGSSLSKKIGLLTRIASTGCHHPAR